VKKAVYLLCALVSFLVFVGCKTDPKGFDLVEYVVSLENNDEYTGYTQTINSESTQYTKIMQYDRGKGIYKYVYETKKLNPFGSEEQYSIVREEEYYANNRRYFFEDEAWNSEEYKYSSGSMQYSFKREYFQDSFELPNSSASEAKFEGKLRDDKVDDFFGEDVNAQNVNIAVTFNAKTKRLLSIEITYQTPSNDTVTIITTISYQYVDLNLPE